MPSHRFTCRACGAELAGPLKEERSARLVAANESHVWLVRRGVVLLAGSPLVPPGLARGDGFHGWLAPLSRERVALHPSIERTIGCCGLSFRSMETANLVCARCGAEVGVGYEDCCGPHWAALFVRSVDAHQDGEGELDTGELDARDLDARVALLDALAPSLAKEVEAARFERRAGGAASYDPASWAPSAGGALAVSQPSLELAAGSTESPSGDPDLLIRSPSFAPREAVRVAIPPVVLARLVLGLEEPFGTPELPLPWRSMRDELEVDVACAVMSEGASEDARREDAHDAEPRVFLGVSGERRVALTFDAREWSDAWRALGARLAEEVGG
ncbi:MAG: hypothetical protein U0353_07735 [Sandaracinus sp.]